MGIGAESLGSLLYEAWLSHGRLSRLNLAAFSLSPWAGPRFLLTIPMTSYEGGRRPKAMHSEKSVTKQRVARQGPGFVRSTLRAAEQ